MRCCPKGRRSVLQTLLGLAAWSIFPGSLRSGAAVTPVAPHSLLAKNRPLNPTPRLALLIGNADYPAPHELPAVHKNVLDLGMALAERGFDVTQAMNLDEARLQAAVGEFVRRVAASPPDSVAFFYYAGHGVQVSANNLLLGSGTNPAAPRRDLLSRSLVLQQRLLAALPARPQALNITVVDACRTDLQSALGDEDGLNQVEAPLGSLVCFSTGAGRPALAPASADQNTFYTASLVRLLREAADHTTFSDLFQMVRHDVAKTMQNHPLPAIRKLAQNPFIADNSRAQVHLSASFHESASSALLPGSSEEEAAWENIRNTTWPVDLVRHCRVFLERYPQSRHVQPVQLYLAGALQAVQVLRSPEVKLFKTGFVLPAPDADSDPGIAESQLARAARGDKDAAARIARAYLVRGAQGSPQAEMRYIGWLQYAGALGNGIASYELALHYRQAGQPLLAAQAEAQARRLGYSPPRALGHERK